MKNFIITMLTVFVALLSVPAEILTWTAATGEYTVAANWDPVQVPATNNEVRLDNGGMAMISSGECFADKLYAGRLAGTTGHLVMSGGSLSVASELYLASASETTGTMTMSSSALLTTGNLKIGAKGSAQMDAGPLVGINANLVYVGMHGPEAIASCDADGTLNLSGTLSAGTLYIASNGGKGRLNLNGGTVNVSNRVLLDYNPGWTQRDAMLTVNGSDGAFSAAELSVADDGATLEFIADAGGFTTLDVNGAVGIDGATLNINPDAYAGTDTFLLLIDGNSLAGRFAQVNFSGSQSGWIIYDDENGDVIFSSVTNEVPPLTLSALFQDNMVLQRDMDVPIWGYTDPGVQVTVKLDDVEIATATADETGRWMVWIGSHPDDGGQPHTLGVSIVRGRDLLVVNVVFGDVYIASGQSNMQSLLPVKAPEEIAVANYPLIRQVRPWRVNAADPLEEPILQSGWTPCTPETANLFGAVSYFFAKQVHLKTQVPVGMLFSAWSGAPIEQFISPEGMEAVPELSGLLQYHEQQGGFTNLHGYYNGMIAPLIPYGVRGAIWYQGESNAAFWQDGDIYRLKLKALIRGWRRKWGQDRFSFNYVQLPNIGNPDWTALREAQRRALSEPDCGMAVTIDVGEDGVLHPMNKWDPGCRLALPALARDFGQDVVYSGPLFYKAVVEESAIRVLFDHADGGLMTGIKDGTNPVVQIFGPLQNFEIASTNKVFVSADAAIHADTVLVSSPAVPEPAYVRYCSTALFESNKLYNVAGLPASPFSTYLSYEIELISGSGSSTGITPGTQVAITANPSPDGQVFDRWIGAASAISNLNASTTTVTMPDHDLFLFASYRDLAETAYTLIVSNGDGSGTSKVGSILNIEAQTPPPGKVFDHWSGDTQEVVNAYAAITTLRMPSGDVTVTAVYWTEDRVGDGISDRWRTFYFGGDGTTTNADSCLTADLDDDGMNFSIGHVEVDFSGFQGHRYTLERAANLDCPDWQPALYNSVGDGLGKHALLDEGVEPAEFFRLRSSMDTQDIPAGLAR